METVKAVLFFEYGDEILWSDHSNETSAAVISHSNIYIVQTEENGIKLKLKIL